MDRLDRLVRGVARTIGDGPGPRRRAQQRRAVAALRVGAHDRRGWWVLGLAVACVLVIAWFMVADTGTRRRDGWRPDEAARTVEAPGTVPVRGGSLPGAGGQRAAGPVDAVVSPEPVQAVARPARREAGWRELAGKGEHAAAIAAAERAGLAALLERLDAAELERLAHSARLAHALGPAQGSLQALRRRFPGDPRAATATFLLGRVALELANDPVRAAEWFGEYVHSQPRGPLAADARARRMQLLHETGDPGGARAAAEDYLQHHPEGARAGLARTILALP